MDEKSKILYQCVQELLDRYLFDEVYILLKENIKITAQNEKLRILFYMYSYFLEKAKGLDNIFQYSRNIEELYLYFTKLKFYLRRLEFDVFDDYTILLIKELQPSVHFIEMLVEYTSIEKEKVLSSLNMVYSKG